MLAFTLTAFLELMDHGIVSWDLISLSFIKQVPRPTKKTIDVTLLVFIETPTDKPATAEHFKACLLTHFYLIT